MGFIKSIIGTVFILTIFGLLFGTTVWMYYSFFLTQEKEPAEYFVLEKQSEKGLFFGPRYQVITDNSESGNYINKKEFDTLQFGDKVTGFETSDYGFFTKTDQLYDGVLLMFLIVVLGAVFLFLMFRAIAQVPWVNRKLKKREAQRRQKNPKEWLGLGLLVVISILLFTYSLLFTINLFHKVVPINQTEVEGHIVDREYQRTVARRGVYSTYYLTIVFTTEDDQVYQVKKGVTGTTYYKHEYKTAIDISYRNRNPYDIFIKTESMGELIGTIISFRTFIYIASLFFFYWLYSTVRIFLQKE